MTNTETLRRLVEVEQDAYLWGQPHRITPQLVDGVWGDGLRLLGLAPLNTRPNYYVVRIHSAWGLDDDLRDFLDEIYDAIEDQFGRALCGGCGCHYGSEHGCEDCKDEPEAEWPAFDDDVGCSWFEIRDHELLMALGEVEVIER